jgi:hypothetical protein
MTLEVNQSHARMVCQTRRASLVSGLNVEPLCPAPEPAESLGLAYPRAHARSTSNL